MAFGMKIMIRIQFRLILATILLFNELAQQTSQMSVENASIIRLRKDTESQSSNENNLISPEKSPLNATLSEPPNHQPAGRSFLHFPNSKNLMNLRTQATNPASIRSSKLIEATPTKTTNPLIPKLPAKLIDGKVNSNNEIGQSANFPSKAKSGQLSIKQIPEPTETPVSVKPKNKKPVPRKVTPPVETTENPSSDFSKQPKKKKPARKLDETTTELTTLNPSKMKKITIRIRANNTQNKVVPKFKNLTILSRSKPNVTVTN